MKRFRKKVGEWLNQNNWKTSHQTKLYGCWPTAYWPNIIYLNYIYINMYIHYIIYYYIYIYTMYVGVPLMLQYLAIPEE